MSNSRTHPIAKIGITIIFAAIGVFGSFKLITGASSSVGGGVVTGVALCGLLIIFFGDVIDWFDLKNLKVQMRKVEDARKEVEEKEKLIKDLANRVADLVEAATEGAFVDESHDEKKFQEALEKVRKI